MHYSMFNVGCSMFDVQYFLCSTFDVQIVASDLNRCAYCLTHLLKAWYTV